MKILLLEAGGRGGSDFFQALLDGHSQILSFPGYLRIDNEFKEMLLLKNIEDIPKRFINIYPEYFDSRLNKVERHHRLGVKKNKFFKVNKELFCQRFVELQKNSEKKNNIGILKALHYAYSIAKKEKQCKKKILFVHTHLYQYTKEFTKIFKEKNIEIVHTIRHPLASLNSPIKRWLTYQNGKNFFSKDLYFQLNLVFHGIFDLMKLKKVFIIQYEMLHWKNVFTMKSFCKKFNIKYENCMKSPTYFGLKWWGDEISQRWISGVNKKFQINIDENYFFKRDLIFLQYLAEDIIKNYKYKLIYPRKKLYFNFLPMKSELLVWKNSFKHLRFKQILSIPFFYILRISLINKLLMNKKKLPISIGVRSN